MVFVCLQLLISLSHHSDVARPLQISGYYNFTHLLYTLECNMPYITPQPDITWIIPNGDSIRETMGDYQVAQTVVNDTLTSTLTISSTDHSMYDGNFTCRVSDVGLQIEDTVNVKYGEFVQWFYRTCWCYVCSAVSSLHQ